MIATRDAARDGREWVRVLARYGSSDPKRSVRELLVTAVPFFLLWALTLVCLERLGYWACLPAALLTAGFLVRLFTIQHDCGHGSFFRRRSANDWIGRVLGVLTLTPYDYWRRAHAVHHATTGHLDRRGVGDITLLTVAEYRALPRWRRIAYRLSRSRLVLLGLGPVYVFILKHRLPVGLMRSGTGAWISAMSTNLAVVGAVVGVGQLVGIRDFLLVQLTITLLAGSAGIWLFYVQHQFEATHWARQDAWSFHEAALRGSTHYDLPGVLRWFTSNIGIHHVHHLSSRIPGYRLREPLADHPELHALGRITLRQSLACYRLALWDEESGKLVGFRDLRTAA